MATAPAIRDFFKVPVAIILVVTSCSVLNRYRRFGDTCYRRLEVEEAPCCSNQSLPALSCRKIDASAIVHFTEGTLRYPQLDIVQFPCHVLRHVLVDKFSSEIISQSSCWRLRGHCDFKSVSANCSYILRNHSFGLAERLRWSFWLAC